MVFKRENISVVLVGFCMVLIGVINWTSMYGGKRRPRNARTKWVFLTLKAENSCKRSLIKSGIFSPSSANSVGWEKSELPDLFWVFLFGLWWKCWTLSLTRALRGVGVNPSEGLGCTHTAEFHHHSPLWAGISHFSISSITFAAPGVTWNLQEFREGARTEPGCCRTENPSAGAAKDNHHECRGTWALPGNWGWKIFPLSAPAKCVILAPQQSFGAVNHVQSCFSEAKGMKQNQN